MFKNNEVSKTTLMEVVEQFSTTPLYMVLAHTNFPAKATFSTPTRLDGEMRNEA